MDNGVKRMAELDFMAMYKAEKRSMRENVRHQKRWETVGAGSGPNSPSSLLAFEYLSLDGGEKSEADADAAADAAAADDAAAAADDDDGGRDLIYFHDFLSSSDWKELSSFLSSIDDWVALSGRRLITFGGIPHPSGSVREPFPSIIERLSIRINRAMEEATTTTRKSETQPKFDNCLVNEYSCGGGISLHNDGPMYQPLVCIYSTSPCLFELVPDREQPPPPPTTTTTTTKTTTQPDGSISVYLKSNSLFAFRNEFYLRYKHTIRPVTHDVIDRTTINRSQLNLSLQAQLPRANTRISLTFRSLAIPELEQSFTAEGLEERSRRDEWFKSSVNDNDM